ncbi:MAG: YibE/F family protein [Bacillota bacterium]|nr:YibE/F family protein [Bacillota bacterium]
MTRKKQPFNVKQSVVWVLTMFLSITAILLGHQLATNDFTLFGESGDDVVRGTVLEVLDRTTDEVSLGDTASYSNTYINFRCRIESGTHEDEVVTAQQNIDTMYGGSEFIKEVEVGDKIMLVNSADAAGEATISEEAAITGETAISDFENIPWQFSDYYRFDKVMMLALVFMLLILLIGRWKGINTLLSLIFTFSFVFFVFVPGIMNGYNVYIGAAITCVFTIIMTLVLINGASKKTWATVIGCVAGTIIAAGTTFIMGKVLHLTGYVDEHSLYLTMMNPDNPIDLTAIIFAAIIIGALGAIMDVAMDISSALFELSRHVPDMPFRKLCKSGMSIGRDIMGTMANTLVLAYIGSSLSSIMLLLTYSMSMNHLLNREVIIVEILQALIGSLAILLTIPCTVAICGLLYLRKGRGGGRIKPDGSSGQGQEIMQRQGQGRMERQRRAEMRKAAEDDIPDWADSWEAENNSDDDTFRY